MKRILILLVAFSGISAMENQQSDFKKVAVLICKKFYQVPTHVDNNELLPAFQNNRLQYEPVVWNDPHVDWKKYDAILVRATWDYIDHHAEFIKVLQTIKEQKIPLFNSYKQVVWNSKKTYLPELANKGIAILDTQMITQKQTPNISDAIVKLPESPLYVIKPAVSGGAHRTFRVPEESLQELYEIQYGRDEEVILQPYAPEIAQGEWSLMFFNGEFSHAVLSKPAEGDFRVQRMHGGTVTTVNPSSAMIQDAQKVLSLVPEEIPLYARVDFVIKNKKNYLMELEIIEPALFLKFDAGAAERFVQALAQKIS